MGTVHTFDHTADVGLRIEAATLDDLFRTAAEGMFDYVVVNRREVQALDPETVQLRSESTADLLVLWLNELIFRAETTHRLFTRFEVAIAADGLQLEATIAGEPIDTERHVLDHEVKAATHHGLTLEQSESHWVAEIILDI